jgi:cellulose synthase/poly-beta-1,6-N-acetylglucosamine synthase-like glycosyltransferase
LVPEGYAPKVSIHIPACREPVDMLKATLDAVARLDYPNFECVVVVNNTPDQAQWRPIEEHCRALGDRFKFLQVEKLTGYKAGALRLALAHTAPDAEIIGSIDADYVVATDWLKELAPLFADSRVGFVQAPQDHRDGDRSLMHYAMNAEYSGFFDIGMVQRNEVNAIVMHGTMCLIRRSAVESIGWSSDTIVEDTDLGLAILEQGWIAITATAVTATVCCPTLSMPISGNAIAGPLAACNWSANTGGVCCRAPWACRPSKSANTA